MRLAAFITLLALPAHADDRAAFYGTWGTPQQCERVPLKEGGTVLAAPFEIDDTFLKQGTIWCRLAWGPVESRGTETVTSAQAQCGEDNVRHYMLGLELADEALTLRWDFPLSNGPLARCTAQ